jgi:hypothetical protein
MPKKSDDQSEIEKEQNKFTICCLFDRQLYLIVYFIIVKLCLNNFALFFTTVYGIFFNYELVLLRFNLSNKMTKTVGVI